MKQILFIIALIASVTLAGCSDFLEEDVRGKENLDTYFQTEEEAISFVNGCYNALTFNGWWQINTVWLLSDMCSDDKWMGNTSQGSDYTALAHYQSNGQSNGLISNFWQYRYKGILKCNIAIDRIDKSTISNETIKNRLIAEAKFLRAYFYFELVRNFGGVPKITGFLMPEEITGITRSTASEIYEFIEEDLKDAAAILPQRSQYAGSDMGRATRGAALGMLGKVYLYQEKWESARDVLGSVITEGEHDLLPNFGDVWSVDHNNSVEGVFEVQFMYDGVYALGGSLTVVTGARNGPGDGWSWGQPTSDLENAFIAAGDDERLKWTIIKSGCTEIAGEDNFDVFVENSKKMASYQTYIDKYGWDEDCYIIDPKDHKSARINRKFFVPYDKRPEVYNIDKIPLNHRILRYADVLLMYAEACNELNDDANARKYLNEVRARVGLGEITSGGNDLRKAIRTERRLELALENNRLYDIRRWTDDNGKKVICNLMGENGTFVKYNTNQATADIYEWENQGEPSNKGATFNENRDLLFPIPLYEITMSNGTITQNPGWN
ncbi:RagB/SusD family nutrient uptake outer membrane protein [Bacteroides sp. 51]|uniref:RagB/SusD family nutrient uptake outer membrane protein n=1 Tax=Bacteroides sp. 51 TaxID=2302938 RepID=UPI0013D76E50|nr:RagB/SusD family nutrient uptake outer membrane protein [Bacteroides sp. 51]NDV80628.1 RagB/SusD family nutrient uptake outer membrane protein [Bacteroides sp. 51]